MTEINPQYYKKKKEKTVLVSYIFLFSVLFLTLILFLYNKKIEGNIAKLSENESQYKTSIQELENNDAIQTAQKYQRHKAFFEKQQYNSQIPNFVSHLKKTALRYGIEAKGFSMSQDKIALSFVAKSDERMYAYEKITQYIREYPSMTGALFSVDPIQNFNGYDTIGFQGNLQILPVLVKNKSEDTTSSGEKLN